jgi:hypothetical protein
MQKTQLFVVIYPRSDVLLLTWKRGERILRPVRTSFADCLESIADHFSFPPLQSDVLLTLRTCEGGPEGQGEDRQYLSDGGGSGMVERGKSGIRPSTVLSVLSSMLGSAMKHVSCKQSGLKVDLSTLVERFFRGVLLWAM